MILLNLKEEQAKVDRTITKRFTKPIEDEGDNDQKKDELENENRKDDNRLGVGSISRLKQIVRKISRSNLVI